MASPELASARPPAVATLFCLFLLMQIVATPLAGAQQAGTRAGASEFDPYPLEPADLSSPRDTLRSFRTNMAEWIHDWDRRVWSARSKRAYQRATSAMDFSETPDANERPVRSARALYLQEILDRVEVPPDSEVPGAREVTEDGVSAWTIPRTSITIARIEDGPRAGEFLFSASTVERLDRLYRHAAHLPYKPGAAVGVLADYLGAQGTSYELDAAVRNRLKPVDTSSPWATLEGLLHGINRAYELTTSARAALRADPPTMSEEQARDAERTASNYLNRAVTTLDLSAVPEALRVDVGVEAALRLKEIFDRMLLPDVDFVPDAADVAAARDGVSGSFASTDGRLRWRYPNTEIDIVEITEGERRGEFLFAAESVGRVSEYYEKVRDLPYRSAAIGLEWDSPQTSEGFYESYIRTPGYMIEDLHFLGRFVQTLPAWLHASWAEQTLWQWVGMVLCVLGVALLSFLTYRWVKAFTRRRSPPLDGWLILVIPVTVAALVSVMVDFIDQDLNFTGAPLVAVRTGGSAIILAMIAWTVFRAFTATAETVIASPRIPDEGVDASLVRLGTRVVGFLLGAWILMRGLHDLGADVVPLLAGLGVGGLAFALAARPTLENVIGSFMIFADKPYRVGQRVNVLGQDGTVESIGLRSTRIRLLSGHRTSIPNEKMAAVEIENIGERPFIKRVMDVTVTYDTSPEKIRRAKEILQEILAVPDAPESEIADGATTGDGETAVDAVPHPNAAINVEAFPPRVYFNNLNADSLNIMVVYWYHPADYWAYCAHAEWVNYQIMERFNAEGIDFAFPTQTLHLAGDEKRPLNVGQRWVPEAEQHSAPAAALDAHSAESDRAERSYR